jgi:tetratricopeptide (TPR) repeat protein
MELMSRDSEARLRAELGLKAALSRPSEPEAPAPPSSAIDELSSSELEALDVAYERARFAFFIEYRPLDALTIIDSAMRDVRWERFVSRRVPRIADCWSLRAFIKNSSARFAEAVEAATNGLKVDIDHVNSLHARGYAYIQIGQYAEALDDLKRGLELATTPAKRRQISGLLDTLRVRT